MGPPTVYTGPKDRFPRGASEGEATIPMCVNPEVEGYAERKKAQGQTPGKTGIIEDGEQQTESDHIGPEDREYIAVKEWCGDNKPTEETRDMEPTTKD
ncbi:hypothetical protein NDU88_003106 [Pleurodeles waltl]|uniref:Uncharacterized protein n=1 Tax=Pleurodeles waltl TaxID=8319 RepID=A0AAV7RFW3_PLEWA|nr:hypothetical protein NDU88_003106 [Pleurodeles waltl]